MKEYDEENLSDSKFQASLKTGLLLWETFGCVMTELTNEGNSLFSS